jgi:D-lactate dehydrogenase
MIINSRINNYFKPFIPNQPLKKSDLFSNIKNIDSISFSGAASEITHPVKNVMFFDIRDEEEKNVLSKFKSKSESLDQGCKSFAFSEKTLNEFLKDQPKNLENISVISVISNSQINEKTIPDIKEKFPNLEMIVIRASGYNNVDTEYCKKNNIKVANVPGYANYAVADYTMALLHNINRKVSDAHADLCSGTVNKEKYKGMELQGKTIGLIGGAGAIGSMVAELALAHRMKILIYDKKTDEITDSQKALIDKAGAFAKIQGEKPGSNIEFVSDIDKLYTQSDVISLHCPYKKNSNHHMLDSAAFSKMKDGVLILNTARGELIDTAALINAIKSGKVGGTGLDVYEGENIKEKNNLHEEERAVLNNLKELKQLNNVIITPHIAYNAIEAIERRLKIACDDIDGLITGKNLNIVG